MAFVQVLTMRRATALRWLMLIPTLLAAAHGAPVLARPRAAPAPSITIGNASVTEGDAGTVNAVFSVVLSNASNKTVTVAYATQNGTATAGSDYLARQGTLSFPLATVTAGSHTVAVDWMTNSTSLLANPDRVLIVEQ